MVHWTLTTEKRAQEWLTPEFARHWSLILLHTCSRYSLVCPSFVLMPDHVHLLLLGTTESSDQSLALSFLRKHTAAALSTTEWQRTAHDHVLREQERESTAFVTIANYIIENPVRAGLVQIWRKYPYVGCCIPGYPEFDLKNEEYWPRFWRCYNYLVSRKS